MIRLPVRPAYNLFKSRVIVFDVTQGRDELGNPIVAVPTPDRGIIGVIQPAGDKAIALLPEGAQSDGAYILHTDAPIYIADNAQGSTQNVQTYARHNGDVWKAWRMQGWRPHQRIQRYILTRYVNVNGNYS